MPHMIISFLFFGMFLRLAAEKGLKRARRIGPDDMPVFQNQKQWSHNQLRIQNSKFRGIIPIVSYDEENQKSNSLCSSGQCFLGAGIAEWPVSAALAENGSSRMTAASTAKLCFTRSGLIK